MKITDEAFIEAWAKWKTIDKIAAATGLKRNSVMCRASRLRKQGVPLPEKKHGKRVSHRLVTLGEAIANNWDGFLAWLAREQPTEFKAIMQLHKQWRDQDKDWNKP